MEMDAAAVEMEIGSAHLAVRPSLALYRLQLVGLGFPGRSTSNRWVDPS